MNAPAIPTVERPIVPFEQRHPVCRADLIWESFARDNPTRAEEIFAHTAVEFMDSAISIVRDALQEGCDIGLQRELIAAQVICLVQGTQRRMADLTHKTPGVFLGLKFNSAISAEEIGSGEAKSDCGGGGGEENPR